MHVPWLHNVRGVRGCPCTQLCEQGAPKDSPNPHGQTCKAASGQGHQLCLGCQESPAFTIAQVTCPSKHAVMMLLMNLGSRGGFGELSLPHNYDVVA